ncbi:hypothetical protein MMC25_008183 [Agyrium rufum]|nr:hypothetical protein [Agyrium rufum]
MGIAADAVWERRMERWGPLLLQFFHLMFATINVGIFSYFISVLNSFDLPVVMSTVAFEGISVAALAYSVYACLLTAVVGGVTPIAIYNVFMDLILMVCWIVAAVIADAGVYPCAKNRYTTTPVGVGRLSNTTRLDDIAYYLNNGVQVPTIGLYSACELNKTAFVVAILGATFFFFSALGNQAWYRMYKEKKVLANRAQYKALELQPSRNSQRYSRQAPPDEHPSNFAPYGSKVSPA